jgi:hypothetical protein
MIETHGEEAPIRARELRRAGINSNYDLIRSFIIGGDELSRYVAGSRINSDNKPVIEFSAPKNLYASTIKENMEDIFEFLQGEQIPVPATGMVHQSDGYLDANFMKLKILTDEDSVVRQLKPQWLISQLLLEKNGAKTYGLVGSERVLTWEESTNEFRIEASWSQTAKNLQDMLNNGTFSAPNQGGRIDLSGGVNAIWLAGSVEGQLRLKLAWACPAQPSGFTHYEVQVSQSDPGQDTWRYTLDSLAGRFHCY